MQDVYSARARLIYLDYGTYTVSIRNPRGEFRSVHLCVAMNRGKEPLVSLCERKFVLDAIKESKVSEY